MEKRLKKVVALILGFLLYVGITSNIPGNQMLVHAATNFTAQQVANNIKVGWNLGNTLDAYNYSWGYMQNSTATETKWSNPITTKAMISAVSKKGFNAIRIPVTYYNHMNKDGTIDSVWLNRVEQVVKYALENNMYVIMNVHHDTGMAGWIYADTDTYSRDKANLNKIWKQIAYRFKNYDTKLLFECTNEILNKERGWDWGKYYKDFRVVHDLNQEFINLVRSTGGNNSIRNLVLSTYGASTDSSPIEQSFYKAYTDTVSGHLILSVHNYMTSTTQINNVLGSLKSYSKKYNIPIIIDEFGTKSSVSIEYRVNSAKYYVQKAKEYGIKCFWWDNGGDYSIFNRKTLEWNYPTIADALVKASGAKTQ